MVVAMTSARPEGFLSSSSPLIMALMFSELFNGTTSMCSLLSTEIGPRIPHHAFSKAQKILFPQEILIL